MTKISMMTLKSNPWPIIQSINLNNVMMMNSNLLKQNKIPNMIWTTIILLNLKSMINWYKNIYTESNFMSKQLKTFKKTMKISMLLFITTELMLFMSMFWMILHNSLSPNIELGMNWPPLSFMKMNPMSIPLTNSILLIASSITITISHHFLTMNLKNKSIKFMIYTITMSMLFLLIQWMEYFFKKTMMKFNMNDSSFSSSFYILTGLHGLHVMIGTLMLMFALNQQKMNSLIFNSHSSFEMISWYWHFVDFMWLFVFSLAYWWNI